MKTSLERVRAFFLGTPREEPDGAVLVEQGSFRVDMRHALEKLREFRLADPDAFLLPWLRCAVASGAREISVARTWKGLRVAFDGRPLPRALIDDPFSYLFKENEPERERATLLAYGLLGALRHRPLLLRVSSGSGAKQACLRLGSAKDLDRGEPPKERTVIELFLTGWLRRWRARRFLACLQPLFPAKPVDLWLDGRIVPEAFGGRHAELAGKPEGVRIQLCRLSAAQANRLELYQRGVYVCEVLDPGPAPHHLALINDDRFTLDLSGAKVVQDARWLWTLTQVRDMLSSRKPFGS